MFHCQVHEITFSKRALSGEIRTRVQRPAIA